MCKARVIKGIVCVRSNYAPDSHMMIDANALKYHYLSLKLFYF